MKASSEKFGIEFRAMGTDVSVEIILDNPGAKASQEAQSALEKVKGIFSKDEKIFSRFDKESELSKINASVGKELAVSEKMFVVLELCVKFNRISEGYFDPRILENLENIGYNKDFRTNDFNREKEEEFKLDRLKDDLGEELILDRSRKTALARRRIDTTGIAKGFTVDEAAQFLKSEGFENFVVDAGGDMFARGSDENGSPWKIGIEGLDDDRVMLEIKDAGIATSGISRKRWKIGEKKIHHLINPKDPENFSYDIKTVTVIEEKTVEADGRAKVLVLMGKERGLQFANEKNIKALFLDYRGNVYLSERMKESIMK